MAPALIAFRYIESIVEFEILSLNVLLIFQALSSRIPNSFRSMFSFVSISIPLFTNESINRLDLAYKVKSIYKSNLPIYITKPDQIILDEHFNVNVPYACVTDNSYTYNQLKYDCSINSGITDFKKELEKIKLNKYKLLDNNYYGN